MITHISANCVNDAYNKGMNLFSDPKNYDVVETRNGKARRAKGMVITEYRNPTKRVLFSPSRDCNPFFHLMEALWMLAGRNDVEWIKEFNSGFGQFSDDGETFWGAYGYRWRRWFGFDQIKTAIESLKKNKKDRRVVIAIWDGRSDLKKKSLDIPCNDTVKLDITDGKLNMYVFNRSNDMIWGAYGSNAVHFSILQEYIAAVVGVRIGTYYQISCDFHVYEEILLKKIDREDSYREESDVYQEGEFSTTPLVTDSSKFDADLSQFMSDAPSSFEGNTKTERYDNSFFYLVSGLRRAWRMWKSDSKNQAYEFLVDYGLEPGMGDDWYYACLQWMERRLKND